MIRPQIAFAAAAFALAACGPSSTGTPVETPKTTSTVEPVAATCAEGKAECDGNAATACETTLATDAAHCGACGTACAVGESCVEGGCRRAQPLYTRSLHACGVVKGNVACWGDNTELQISAGSKSPIVAPALMKDIDGALTVKGSDRYGCAVLDTGKIHCWGQGKSREVPFLQNVADVAVSDRSACAVLKSGEVKCVEFGYSGDDLRPEEGPKMRDATAITAGVSHFCALHKTGEVTCWGEPEYTGAGIDTENMEYEKREELRKVPVKVKDLSDAVQVSANDRHTCVVRKTKQVACWGRNWSGELGDGSTEDRHVPVDVGLLEDVVQVSAGVYHTCALRQSGKVVCWGDNGSGQLGGGTGSSRGLTEVTGLTDADFVSAGNEFSCAHHKGGGFSCWGTASRGRLGNGTISDPPAPLLVPGVSGATKVIAGDRHSCAVDGKGALTCWGVSSYGRVSEGKRGIPPAAIPGLGEVKFTSAAGNQTCVTNKANEVYCFDGGTPAASEDPLPGKPLKLGTVKAVFVNSWASVALTPSGQVFLWARNTADNKPDEILKANVSGISDAVDVATEGGSLCAVRKSGKVGCIGFHYKTFAKKDAVKPTSVMEIPNLTDAVSIAYGGGEYCVVRKTGAVSCWSTWRLPRPVEKASKTPPPKPEPIELRDVRGLTDAVSLALGGGSCALTKAGIAVCWGSNSAGQLGTGDYEYRSQPTPVKGLSDLVSLAQGSNHGCAANKSGQVYCWGRNYSDQLGVDVKAYHFAPTKVLDPK